MNLERLDANVKYVVDLDVCENHGVCLIYAPDVFDFNDEGELNLRDEVASGDAVRPLDPGQLGGVREAASMCPMQAIRIEE
jgi:ferredoxin